MSDYLPLINTGINAVAGAGFLGVNQYINWQSGANWKETTWNVLKNNAEDIIVGGSLAAIVLNTDVATFESMSNSVTAIPTYVLLPAFAGLAGYIATKAARILAYDTPKTLWANKGYLPAAGRTYFHNRAVRRGEAAHVADYNRGNVRAYELASEQHRANRDAYVADRDLRQSAAERQEFVDWWANPTEGDPAQPMAIERQRELGIVDQGNGDDPYPCPETLAVWTARIPDEEDRLAVADIFALPLTAEEQGRIAGPALPKVGKVFQEQDAWIAANAGAMVAYAHPDAAPPAAAWDRAGFPNPLTQGWNQSKHYGKKLLNAVAWCSVAFAARLAANKYFSS